MNLINLEILLANNDWNLFFDEINRTLDAEKQNDELYLLRGKAYYKLGNWQQAIENFMKAQDINPQSPAKHMLQLTKSILEYHNVDIYGG